MGTRQIEQGPTAKRVAANVRALREARRLSLGELSARLRQIGRPILPSGLSKIEAGDRRVDVDDLVALAHALDTTPNRLMLPAGAGSGSVLVSERVRVSERAAWEWFAGEQSPPDLWKSPDVDVDGDRERRWRRENRPQAPGEVPLEEMDAHGDTLRPVIEAYDSARDAGTSAHMIGEALKLHEFMRKFLGSRRAPNARED